MAHNITAEFVMDYEGEEPKRLVRLTVDKAVTEFLRVACRAYGDLAMNAEEPLVAEEAYGFSQAMLRLTNELNSRSLFNQEEFKATKPEPGDDL